MGEVHSLFPYTPQDLAQLLIQGKLANLIKFGVEQLEWQEIKVLA